MLRRSLCCLALLVVVPLAGCSMVSEGRRVAQAETGCQHLDTVTPVPQRYVNNLRLKAEALET